jgi:tetrapyrrole methylase family protein/MazG family protein
MAEASTQNDHPMQRLIALMARLRGPDGCPWDREQTHRSLQPYVIEETYEVLEAVENQDPDKLCEELGDLLLQVVFHAQLAAEQGQFTMIDVINGIAAKLVRRHPHVFGEVKVAGVAGVLENWEQIKREEYRAERKSALDGVPQGLPGLLQAEKLQNKAAKVGFDWGDLEGPLAKVKEEFAELEAVLDPAALPAAGSSEWDRLEDEFGDILFSLVNVARFIKVNPEMALRHTIAKFIGRFHFMEQAAQKDGKTLNEMDLTELDRLWKQAK